MSANMSPQQTEPTRYDFAYDASNAARDVVCFVHACAILHIADVVLYERNRLDARLPSAQRDAHRSSCSSWSLSSA